MGAGGTETFLQINVSYSSGEETRTVVVPIHGLRLTSIEIHAANGCDAVGEGT